MNPEIKAWLESQFGEDPEIVGEVYGEYVVTSKAKLAELAADFAARDWSKLDRTAHTIKGNALMVGDKTVADAAIALRAAAKAGADAEAAALVGKIKELLAPVVGGGND